LDGKRYAPFSCALGTSLSRQTHGLLGMESMYNRRTNSPPNYLEPQGFGGSLGTPASGPGLGGCALFPPGSAQPGSPVSGFREATVEECEQARIALKVPPGDGYMGLTFCHGDQLMWCVFEDRIKRYLDRNFPQASSEERKAFAACARSHEKGHATSDWKTSIPKGSSCKKCAAGRYCTPHHEYTWQENHTEYLSWAFAIGCAAGHLEEHRDWESLKHMKDHGCSLVKEIPGYKDSLPELYDCNH